MLLVHLDVSSLEKRLVKFFFCKVLKTLVDSDESVSFSPVVGVLYGRNVFNLYAFLAEKVVQVLILYVHLQVPYINVY